MWGGYLSHLPTKGLELLLDDDGKLFNGWILLCQQIFLVIRLSWNPHKLVFVENNTTIYNTYGNYGNTFYTTQATDWRCWFCSTWVVFVQTSQVLSKKQRFFSSSWEHPTCEKGVSSLKNNIGEKLIHIMSLVGMLLNLPPQNLQKNIAKTVFQPPFFRGYVKCKLRVRLQQTCIFSSYIRMILRWIDRGSSVCFFVDLGPTTIYPLPTSYPREN